MAPLLPLGFIMAYQVDAAYGTLTHRMRGAAPPPAPFLLNAAKLCCCAPFRGSGEDNGVRAEPPGGASWDAHVRQHREGPPRSEQPRRHFG